VDLFCPRHDHDQSAERDGTVRRYDCAVLGRFDDRTAVERHGKPRGHGEFFYQLIKKLKNKSVRGRSPQKRKESVHLPFVKNNERVYRFFSGLAVKNSEHVEQIKNRMLILNLFGPKRIDFFVRLMNIFFTDVFALLSFRFFTI